LRKNAPLRTFLIGAEKPVDATFHESDERLELYALDRLSDSDVIRIEEHLMICDSCRDRLDEAANFAFSIRAELKSKPQLVSQGASGWFSWLEGKWAKPGFALAGALAMAVIAVSVFHGGGVQLTPVAALQLTAMRGTDIKAVAPSRELDLTFDDAPANGAQLSVEVVDSGGTPVWHGVPEANSNGVQAKIRKTLEPGEYFARLYDSPSHLVHEYAFRIDR
jgi:hypothetical protein